MLASNVGLVNVLIQNLNTVYRKKLAHEKDAHRMRTLLINKIIIF